MISISNSQLLLLIFFLFTTTSHALFFNYPKNVLMDFFETLREKKEMKKEMPSDIHHYHIHYYPVYMHSPKSIKAPDKNELENLHSNKLEAHGWNNQEYKNVPEPKLHHLLGLDNLASSLGHRPWWEENTVDRHEESKGIVVQVPLNQQIILHQPKEEEKPTNPLVAFFQKLKHIKNSIFSHHSDKKEEDEEHHKDHKISTVFVYTHPNKIGHYP